MITNSHKFQVSASLAPTQTDSKIPIASSATCHPTGELSDSYETIQKAEAYSKVALPLTELKGNKAGEIYALKMKYRDIMVQRYGTTPTAYMVTENIVGEVRPGLLYQIGEFGLKPDHKPNALLEKNIEAQTPPLVRIPTRWSKKQCQATQEANILGRNDSIFVKETRYEIPVAPTTPEYLAYYGVKLLNFGESIQFESDGPMPITKMKVGKDYPHHYLQEKNRGGGFYIEGHDRPHFHMPVNKQAGGYLILGKQISVGELALSAFSIPYGQAIYTPPWVLHDDAFLHGDLFVVYSKTEKYSTGIFRTASNDETVRFTVEANPIPQSADD